MANLEELSRPFCWWCGGTLDPRTHAKVEGHKTHISCAPKASEYLRHLTADIPDAIRDSGDKVLSSKKPDADHQ